MTYHLFWALETLKNWTELALQRVTEPGGPESEEYEVLELELDWCVLSPLARRD